MFRTLCGKLPNTVIITVCDVMIQFAFQKLTNKGKGYPDFATRHLLSVTLKQNPGARIYILVDSDPYGIQIFCTYKYGALKTKHLEDHVCSSARFLGVSVLEYQDGWLPMGQRDLKLAFSMLKTMAISNEPGLNILKRELQLQLFLGKKAEINVIRDDTEVTMVEYIQKKLKRSFFSSG